MLTFPGLQSNDLNGFEPVDRIQKSSSNSVEQFIEQQKLAKILHAKQNVDNIKLYRIQTEKSNKEREIDEKFKKEIRKPLEEALLEVEVLRSKINRREDMIIKLRSKVLNEIMEMKLNQHGVEDVRKRTIEEIKEEEVKILQLFDDMASMELIIDNQTKDLIKLRKIVTRQFDKIRELMKVRDESEFYFKEKIYKLETERNMLTNKLSNQEVIRNNLETENQIMNNEIVHLKLSNESLVIESNEKDQKILELNEQVHDLQLERIDLTEEFNELTEDFQRVNENYVTEQEKNAFLDARYEELVQELDKMVEDGYTLPNESNNPNPLLESPKIANKKKRITQRFSKFVDIPTATAIKHTQKNPPQSRRTSRARSMSQEDNETIDTCNSSSTNDDELIDEDARLMDRKKSISFSFSHSNSQLNIPTEQPKKSAVKWSFKDQKIEDHKKMEKKFKEDSTLRMNEALRKEVEDIKEKLSHEQKLRVEDQIKWNTNQLLHEKILQKNHNETVEKSVKMAQQDDEIKILKDKNQRLSDALHEAEQKATDMEVTMDKMHSVSAERKIGNEASILLSLIGSLDSSAHSSHLSNRVGVLNSRQSFLQNLNNLESKPIVETDEGPETSHNDSTTDEKSSTHLNNLSINPLLPSPPITSTPAVVASQKASVMENGLDGQIVYDNQGLDLQDEELGISKNRRKSFGERSNAFSKADLEEGGDKEDDDEVHQIYGDVDVVADKDMYEYMTKWEYIREHSKDCQVSAVDFSSETAVETEEVYLQNEVEIFLHELFQSFKMETYRCVPKSKVTEIKDDVFNNGQEVPLSKFDLNRRLDSPTVREMKEGRRSPSKSPTKTGRSVSPMWLDEEHDNLDYRLARCVEYLANLNLLRNSQIQQISQANARNTENARLVIRSLDLVIQTLHYILAPSMYVKMSEYPEIKRANETNGMTSNGKDRESSSPIVSRTATPRTAPRTTLENEEPLDEESKIKTYFDDDIVDDKEEQKVNPIDETFELTQTILVADSTVGAPRGILNSNLANSDQRLSKQCMNRSNRPRTVPYGVDQLLDTRPYESYSNTSESDNDPMDPNNLFRGLRRRKSSGKSSRNYSGRLQDLLAAEQNQISGGGLDVGVEPKKTGKKRRPYSSPSYLSNVRSMTGKELGSDGQDRLRTGPIDLDYYLQHDYEPDDNVEVRPTEHGTLPIDSLNVDQIIQTSFRSQGHYMRHLNNSQPSLDSYWDKRNTYHTPSLFNENQGGVEYVDYTRMPINLISAINHHRTQSMRSLSPNKKNNKQLLANNRDDGQDAQPLRSSFLNDGNPMFNIIEASGSFDINPELLKEKSKMKTHEVPIRTAPSMSTTKTQQLDINMLKDKVKRPNTTAPSSSSFSNKYKTRFFTKSSMNNPAGVTYTDSESVNLASKSFENSNNINFGNDTDGLMISGTTKSTSGGKREKVTGALLYM